MTDSTQVAPHESHVKRASYSPIHSGLTRRSVTVFLGLLVLLFVTSPFVQELPNGRLIEAGLATAVLSAAVLAVGGRRRTLAIAILLVVPALIAHWIHHLHTNDASFRWYIASYMVFLGFVVFQFLRFILQSPRVDSEVLSAAVSAYLLLGIFWASAYAFVARGNPTAFAGVAPADQPLHGFPALYFSMITLTTVGYGDITPVSAPARMLAMVEATVGTMYMAVLVARLVSIHSSTSASKDASHN
jgi:hypothetical protein